MLYTNGSFEICQERMFVKQHRKNGWSSYLLPKNIFMLKKRSSNLYIIGFKSKETFWVIVYPHYIRNRSQWNAMWRDKQPHGYSRPIICRSYFDLISGHSKPILGRSYADLISGHSRPILFRSYFGLQQADLISALGETRAWLQAKPQWLQAT